MRGAGPFLTPEGRDYTSHQPPRSSGGRTTVPIRPHGAGLQFP